MFKENLILPEPND